MKGKEEALSLQAPSISTNSPVPSCGQRKSVNWAHPLAVMSTEPCKNFPIKRSSARLCRKALSSNSLRRDKTKTKTGINFEKRVFNNCAETSDENAEVCVIAYCRTNKASTEATSKVPAAGSTEPHLQEPKCCLNEGSNSRMHKRARIVEQNGEEQLSDDDSSIEGQAKGWVSVRLDSMEAEKWRSPDCVSTQDIKSFKVSSDIGPAKTTSLERSVASGNIRVTCKEKVELLSKKSEIHEFGDNECREALARSKRVIHELEQLISKVRENKLQKLLMEKNEMEAIAALEQKRLRDEIIQLSQKNSKILEEKLVIERDRDSVKKDFSSKLEKELGSYRLKIDRDHAEIVATLTVELGKEQEKSRCQICFTSPRDAIILPCSHFQYCNECLQEHQRRLKECPTCRAKINGVIRCNLLAS